MKNRNICLTWNMHNLVCYTTKTTAWKRGFTYLKIELLLLYSKLSHTQIFFCPKNALEIPQSIILSVFPLQHQSVNCISTSLKSLPFFILFSSFVEFCSCKFEDFLLVALLISTLTCCLSILLHILFNSEFNAFSLKCKHFTTLFSTLMPRCCCLPTNAS